jgi:S-DNA-T family DNA segregation ATPase FtsK/SpoIIIE
MQCAVAGKGASVTDQVAAIHELGAFKGTSPTPPEVRTLPAHLDATTLPATNDPLMAPIGLDERFEVATCDLRHGHILIAGPPRSGRSTTLAVIALQMARADRPPPVHLLSPRERGIDPGEAFASVTTGLEACESWIRASREELAEKGGIVLIDDGDELFDVLFADDLQSTMRWGRDHDARFVVAVESHAAHREFGGWLAELKKEKHGLLLDPELEVDGDLLSARLPRRKSTFPPGRGYLVMRGESKLIQVARPDRSRDNDEGQDLTPRP